MPILVPEIQPYPQVLFRQPESPFFDGNYPGSVRPSMEGWAISNSSELLEGIADALAGSDPVFLNLATNEYAEVSNMIAGKDFAGKKLTIRGRNPASRPLIVGSPQSLVLSRNIEISDIDFQLGYVTDTWHFSDGGGTASNGWVSDLSLKRVKLSGISKDLNAAPSATYREGMCDGIRLTNSFSKNHTIEDVETEFMNRAIEMKMNGDVLIRRFVSRYAYYDNFRIVGQGDEGRAEGDRYIIDSQILDGIGSYEEINDGEPHLDGFQFFNATGTNTRVENLLIYNFLMNHGPYRGSRIQGLLAQVPLVNVKALESIIMTKSAPHGFYLEGGGAVSLERCSLADWDWSPPLGGSPSSVRGRAFKMTGEVTYKNTYTLSAIDAPTVGDNANLPGYNLRSINSDPVAGADGAVKHAAVYAGSGDKLGAEGAKAMLTPLVDDGRGAISIAGEWRGLTTHLPLQAAAPEATGGSGQISITEVKKPTLGLFAVGLGTEPTYKYNARVCVADSHSWTVIEDASTSTVFSGLDAGSYWVQTQCVNSASASDSDNAGEWSKTKIVTVT